MIDDRTVQEIMNDLGITTADLARWAGVDASYLTKQVRGDRPLQGIVKTAFVDALDQRAIAALTHVARLLRDDGEPEAAEACERLWESRRGGLCPEDA